ncbi:hypothetical protein EJ07DRAFT_162340 [Lizonia empirigonia]|nr:hypothetical protein EJ07DRAFT_162340 [Lizonia empirigonia]
MSLLLSTTLLVSVAAAQLTTSIWLPGAANANQSFVGSMVAQTGDRTTLSVAFDGPTILTEYYGTGPDYVTVGGTTYMAYLQTATDAGSDNSATVDIACSRTNGNAVPTCAYTMRDLASENSLRDSLCSSQMGTSTTTYVYFLNNYRLIITVGTEKLNASAAATPTGSGAQSTVASVSSSAAGSSGPSQATGAAAPMLTISPVLAGLGAAAAFFV